MCKGERGFNGRGGKREEQGEVLWEERSEVRTPGKVCVFMSE